MVDARHSGSFIGVRIEMEVISTLCSSAALKAALMSPLISIVIMSLFLQLTIDSQVVCCFCYRMVFSHDFASASSPENQKNARGFAGVRAEIDFRLRRFSAFFRKFQCLLYCSLCHPMSI